MFVGGALFVVPEPAMAEGQKQESIRLGVDPNHYLKNRHKRVHRARQQANVRAAAPQQRAARPAASNGGSANFGGSNGYIGMTPELANRPGFNEFSYLNNEERQDAEEIMQFLKSFQPQATP